jgi:hypothetical protein
MIYDALTLVSSDQAVTATAVTEDSYDLGVNRDIGQGTDLFLVFMTKVAVTAAGAATVTFEAVTADDGALTTNVTVLGSSAAIGKAALPIGAMIAFKIPPQFGTLGRRYLGGRYTIGTGPLTAGTFDAFLAYDVPDTATFYPTRIVV